jgi:dihydrofolate reductase
LTHIHKIYEGDTLFPALPESQWKETARQKGNESGSAGIEYEFITYQKV